MLSFLKSGFWVKISKFQSSVFLDIYNVFNSKNVWDYDYYYKYGRPVKSENLLLPVIPFMGLSIEF